MFCALLPKFVCDEGLSTPALREGPRELGKGLVCLHHLIQRVVGLGEAVAELEDGLERDPADALLRRHSDHLVLKDRLVASRHAVDEANDQELGDKALEDSIAVEDLAPNSMV